VILLSKCHVILIVVVVQHYLVFYFVAVLIGIYIYICYRGPHLQVVHRGQVFNTIKTNLNLTKSTVELKVYISYRSSMKNYRKIGNYLICYWCLSRLTVFNKNSVGYALKSQLQEVRKNLKKLPSAPRARKLLKTGVWFCWLRQAQLVGSSEFFDFL
jgi:hypothetical protein